MAKKHHHLYKRGEIWHFRKDGYRFSLETRVAKVAIEQRDKLLENYRLYGVFCVHEQAEDKKKFGQVVKEWAGIHEKKVKYSTWRDYRSAMNTHVLPYFKDRTLEDILFQDVEKFISKLNCGTKRINNILVPLRSVFDYAFKCGYLQENIMLKVDNRKLEQPDINPFTYDEVMLIIENATQYYKPLMNIKFFTGLRDGETYGAEWFDYKQQMKPMPQIHINKAFVYGQNGKTKTKGSKRYVDCIDLVVEALEDQRKLTGDKQNIFLTQDGARMTPDHFRNVVWKPALKKAGLDYRPPIQTRHTFATMMLTAGEDIGWVQNMMGHSSLQMIFTRYYKWIPTKTRNDGSAFMGSIKDTIDIDNFHS